MLTQQAADFLARLSKQITSATVVMVPPTGSQIGWVAESVAPKHRFHVHMRRGRKLATQITLQERYETNEILIRLDIDGPNHGNPDGTVVPTPHLHIYREGYEDKWAFPVPPELDISSGNPTLILINFLDYCGVTPIPPVQGGLLP